jgi:hypothetical protein
MSHFGNSSRRFTPEDLRIDATEHPDWVNGAERLPRLGEHVLCTGGLAEVVQMLGKTGDGSRLLALRLLNGTHPPFFVAASNVLLQPPGRDLVNGMIG